MLDILLYLQTKTSIINLKSIRAATVCFTCIVVMFVVIPEKPRSILGPTFVFATANSLVFPIMFIAGNNKIFRHAENIYYELFVPTGAPILCVPIIYFLCNAIVGGILSSYGF